MKPVSFLLLTMLAFSVRAKEIVYTGSTPAGTVVRTFLSIPVRDPIDFIRWKLTVLDEHYVLSCNYGIGQPNTNGFFGGGKWIEQRGGWKKLNSFYYLQDGNKTLSLFLISANLLQIADTSNKLLVGNGGWSYTLSRTVVADESSANVSVTAGFVADSVVFQGRTPCLPNNNQQSENCYKRKWKLVLIGGTGSGKSSAAFVQGTVFNHKRKAGTWSTVAGENGRKLYRIVIENETPLYFLKLDENLLLFTDTNGHPLVGNEDFSFTLNRIL